MKTILQALFLLTTTYLCSQTETTTDYYRHLRYNHISPYIDLSGIHPIDEKTAESASHYVFKYDAQGMLSEILNNHYHTEKKHALASIGAFQVIIAYAEGKEVRTFLDPNGKSVSNDRGVFKEVYSLDENNLKSRLNFYDLNDQPMESNWAIAEYQWTHGGDLIIERRYNIDGEAVNVSPYFDFGITGIQVDENGLGKGHFNLNQDLEIANNAMGLASYRDVYDEKGNHVTYSYYNDADSLTLNQWQFAIGRKSYDDLGNNILLEQLGPNGEVLNKRGVYSNATIEISQAASSQDSSDIRMKSLGYLKALQTLDPVLMNEVMNDSLNKVTIGYDRNTRREVARPTTREQMMAFAEDWNKSNTKFPYKPNDDVSILNIYDRIASVKLISDNWVEYLHLIKLDQEWQIVNLIWQHKDVNRYPK